MPAGDRHDPRDIGMAVWLLELGVSSRKIESHLRGRISHVTISRLRRRYPPTEKETTLEERSETRNLHVEIDHYAPCLSSSFNNGLGTVTPPAAIDRAVKDSNQESGFRELPKLTISMTKGGTSKTGLRLYSTKLILTMLNILDSAYHPTLVE